MGRLTQMVSNVLWWTSLNGRNGVEKSDIESNMRRVSKSGIMISIHQLGVGQGRW